MGTDVVTQSPTYPVLRRWPRYKLDVPVRVISRKADKTVITPGRGTELNGGGLNIFAGVELNVDDTIEVEFTPPYSGDPIRVRAVVRNRRGYDYGIEFLLETDDDHEQVSMIRGVFAAMGSRIS